MLFKLITAANAYLILCFVQTFIMTSHSFTCLSLRCLTTIFIVWSTAAELLSWMLRFFKNILWIRNPIPKENHLFTINAFQNIMYLTEYRTVLNLEVIFAPFQPLVFGGKRLSRSKSYLSTFFSLVTGETNHADKTVWFGVSSNEYCSIFDITFCNVHEMV